MIFDKVEKYIEIAVSTGAFKITELDILREILDDINNNSNTTYIIFDEIIENTLAGFVIFGRTPMTESSWDIYWLVVDKKFQGKGIGKKLLKLMEEHIKGAYTKAILRLETSTKKEYAAARGLYKKAGFSELGALPDFYSEGDDLIIFYKVI